MPPTTTPSRPAFTLLELSVVVVLMGILGAAVIPAISTISAARIPAAADAIAREIGVARQRAMNLGRSACARVDASTGEISLLELPVQGTTPVAMVDVLGQQRVALVVGSVFPGVAVMSAQGFDVTPGPAMLWFGADGVPERRGVDGTLLGLAAQDAIVELTDVVQVRVHASTGMIE